MIRFIDQPNKVQMGRILVENLSIKDENSFDTLYLIIAFVKKSGLSRIQKAINNFKSNGGKIKAVVGIDQGGTSIQGLKLLYELLDEIYVYHNRNPSHTFHPKVFIFEKENIKASVLIGSSNVTMGGIFTNYEMGVQIDFNLKVQEDLDNYKKIRAIFDEYSDTTKNCCEILDKELLNKLIEGKYLGDEEKEYYIFRKKIKEKHEEVLFGTESLGTAPPSFEEVGMIPESDSFTNFIMTIQWVDIGKQIAPEIFIPLEARDFCKEFWEWNTKYKRKYARKHYYDEFYTNISVKCPDNPPLIERTRIYYYSGKHDFRFTSKEIRRLADQEKIKVGDLLLIEKVQDDRFDYMVKIIPQSDTYYTQYLEKCDKKTKYSKRRWGYF